MPNMDGHEVTRRLRAWNRPLPCPTATCTTKVMKGDREKTLESGCSGYIEKPIDVDRFPGQVAVFLEEH